MGESMKAKCSNCCYEFDFDTAYQDKLGWHTTCPNCKGSSDIDIDNYLIPNGTKVLVNDNWVGIVDGNDEVDTEEIRDINYYVCPIEFTGEKGWSDYYSMELRQDLKVIS